ncbi:MAG: ABC transporter ATP-binding protein [Chloroflexia bacterium]
MAGVTFEHITKKYAGGDVFAVNDLNLDIRDKEFLVLVGPSGCGKSTALRMIAGLEDITSGLLKIGDRVVNNVPPKDRDIAMVFQSYALYPHMTVYDNMAFGLRMRKAIPSGTPAGMSREAAIKKRVNEVAETIGLTQFLTRKPRQLSGGQRQRVALGRAIVRNPQVFLMDEPLSNLDAKLRVQTRATISRLHRDLQTTMIYVTHDQVEAMTMGDRIAVMRDGILQQLDTPQNLYDHPQNMFVAGFIGSPSMNFFPATPELTGNELYINADGFRVKVPQQYRQALQSHAGKEITFGLRPEDVADVRMEHTVQEDTTVPVTVDVVEPMGSEIYLYLLTSGKHPFVARVDPLTRVQPGEQLQVAFDMAKMHAFDPTTQETLM